MNQKNNSIQEKKKLDEENNYYELDLSVVFQGIRRNKKLFLYLYYCFSWSSQISKDERYMERRSSNCY